MRQLSVCAFLCLATPTCAQQALPWFKATEFYYTTSQVRMYPNNVVWGGQNVPQPWGGQLGKWNLVDLKPWGVPPDAQAAFLSGILIITHGTTEEIADMKITFRRPGDGSADCKYYIAQTEEAQVGGGQRVGMATWVPLTNGQFEWCATGTTTGTWPVHSSYGVNLSVQAWVR